MKRMTRTAVTPVAANQRACLVNADKIAGESALSTRLANKKIMARMAWIAEKIYIVSTAAIQPSLRVMVFSCLAAAESLLTSGQC